MIDYNYVDDRERIRRGEDAPTLLRKIKRLEALVSAYAEYTVLLGKEVADLMGLAYVHGWESTRVEEGKACREKIAVLTQTKGDL